MKGHVSLLLLSLLQMRSNVCACYRNQDHLSSKGKEKERDATSLSELFLGWSVFRCSVSSCSQATWEESTFVYEQKDPTDATVLFEQSF